MRMLKMSKAELKAPAITAILMTFGVYFLPLLASIIQPAVFMGAGGLCAPSAHTYTGLFILGKLLLFLHIIERFHTSRSCDKCVKLRDGDPWKHRFEKDCAFCVLMLVSIAGTVMVLISSSVLVSAEFNPSEITCTVIMPKPVMAIQYGWILVSYAMLLVAFWALVLCTTMHYKEVNADSEWQTKVRQRLQRLLPNWLKQAYQKKFLDIPDSRDSQTPGFHDPSLRHCPAHLCRDLPAELAGAMEKVALKGILVMALTFLPTIGNLIFVFVAVQNGQLTTWAYALCSTLDGKHWQNPIASFYLQDPVTLQCVIMHIFNRYPGDTRDDALYWKICSYLFGKKAVDAEANGDSLARSGSKSKRHSAIVVPDYADTRPGLKRGSSRASQASKTFSFVQNSANAVGGVSSSLQAGTKGVAGEEFRRPFSFLRPNPKRQTLSTPIELDERGSTATLNPDQDSSVQPITGRPSSSRPQTAGQLAPGEAQVAAEEESEQLETLAEFLSRT
jgi:hypothetical protein